MAQSSSELTGGTASSGSVPWARQSTKAPERVTARMRRVVQGLPDWEPAPPGELTVRRSGSI